MKLVIGTKYAFKNGGSKPLIYIGQSGLWHQFEEEDNRGEVWAEVLDSDLWMLEGISND